MNRIDKEVCRLTSEIGTVQRRRHDTLKNLDLFILDNSVRESTVGQLCSHTLQDKIHIYEQVKECGIEDIIVASFTDMKGVDDDFCQYLVDQHEDFSKLYSFSEVSDSLRDGAYDMETIPIPLQKSNQLASKMSFLKLILQIKSASWKRSSQQMIAIYVPTTP